MTSDRVCANHGLLVDGRARLSTDPCEYYDERVRELVGCARLRCTKCEAAVRTGPLWLVPTRSIQAEIATLYGTKDWSTLSYVHEDKVYDHPPRLYACRCRWWVATRVDSIDNEHDSESDPDLPWTCAGHPQPTFPLSLDELRIDAGSDWAKVVDSILGGAAPRRLAREDSVGDEPAAWLVWLRVYLNGLSAAAQLSAAIAKRIADGDPRVVGRVLYFFTTFARVDGVERLIAHAEKDVHRVAIGYPIPEFHRAPTLWGVLVARLEQQSGTPDALDARVDALVRRILLLPLSSLSHEDLGPSSLVELERENRIRHGKDVDTAGGQQYMRDFTEVKQEERADVVVTALRNFTTAFDGMREFIADHIVEIDAASPGRWRPFMDLLTDGQQKENGHLIVVAGARVIKAGLVTADEFRAWVEARRAYGWVADAWVLPLETMLAEK